MRPGQRGGAGWRTLQSVGEQTQKAGSGRDELPVEVYYSEKLLQLPDCVGDRILRDGGHLFQSRTVLGTGYLEMAATLSTRGVEPEEEIV